MNFVLRVTDGGTEYVYDSAQHFGQGALETTVKLRDGARVENESLTVNLYADSFVGRTEEAGFLGASPMRAQLEKESGEVIANGRIVPAGGGVKHRDLDGRWQVEILQDAGEVLSRRLKDLDILTIVGPEYEVVDVQSTPTDEQQESGDAPPVSTMRAYNIESLFERVLEEVGATFGRGHQRGIPLTQSYIDDEGVTQTITRRFEPHMASLERYEEIPDRKFVYSDTLPDWTADEFVQAVLDLRGLALDMRYGPYPSGAILVDTLTDEVLPEPSAIVENEDLHEDAVWREIEAPEFEDMALTMESGAQPPENVPPDVFVPTALGGIGAEQFRMTSGGEVVAEGILELPFKLPPLRPRDGFKTDTVADGSYSETVHTGRVWHDGTVSDVWLGIIQEIDGDAQFVAYREPDNPAPDELPRISAAWAYNLFQQYDLARREHLLSTPAFYSEASPRALESLSWEGDTHQVIEARKRYDDNLLNLKLAFPGPPPPPRNTPPVQAIDRAVSFADRDNSNSQLITNAYVGIDMRRRRLSEVPAEVYETEKMIDDGPWEDRFRTRDTTVRYPPPPGGSSIRFRARAVTSGGRTTEWETTAPLQN